MNADELRPGARVTWRRDGPKVEALQFLQAEVVAVKRSTTTFHTRPNGERFNVRVPERVKVRCTIAGAQVERWVADYNLQPAQGAP